MGKHIEVHSFGRCLHNRDLEHDTSDLHAIGPLGTLSKYKFYIAMENSNCLDYVSEKLLRAWQIGIIPIVVTWKGVPDYSKFVPNNYSFIDAGKFRGPQHLAEYLKKLAHDERLYNEYLSYRYNSADIFPFFRKLWSVNMNDPEGWCPLVAKMSNPEQLEMMAVRRLKGDHSCAPRGDFA